MDPGCERKAIASLPVGSWSVFCTFSPTRARCCILYTWRFPKIWIVAVWCAIHVPRYARYAETPRGVRWLGLQHLAFQLRKCVHYCLGPIGAGAPRLLVGRYGDAQLAQKDRLLMCLPLLVSSRCSPPARRTLENFIPTEPWWETLVVQAKCETPREGALLTSL